MIKISSKLTRQLHHDDVNPCGKCYQNKAFSSLLQIDELAFSYQATNALQAGNADPVKLRCAFLPVDPNTKSSKDRRIIFSHTVSDRIAPAKNHLNASKYIIKRNINGLALNKILLALNRILLTLVHKLFTLGRILFTLNRIILTINKILLTLNRILLTLGKILLAINRILFTINRILFTINKILITGKKSTVQKVKLFLTGWNFGLTPCFYILNK